MKAGDIINNGWYDIKLTETPHWNDLHNRWYCCGKRWVPALNKWEDRTHVYGWVKSYPLRWLPHDNA